VSTATLGSKLGTGGMETKLIAAEIATAAGVATVVTSSKIPENVFKIIEYNIALAKSTSRPISVSSSSNVSTPTSELTSVSIASQETVTGLSSVATEDPSAPLHVRPPHTLFRPSATPLRDAKSWTAYTLAPAGNILIDAGAHRVLSKRDSGGRLLAVGVVDVSGVFASGQAVRILVRKHVDGVAAASSSHALFTGVADSGASTPATPATPSLLASSLSAMSVSSLDPFSRSGSEGSMMAASISNTDATPVAGTLSLPAFGENRTNLLAGASDKPKENTVQFSGVVGPEEGWIDVEVGRGLANYNSAEISRIKGVKRYARTSSFCATFLMVLFQLEHCSVAWICGL
jgi:glutamate 5-kinase